MSTHPSIDPAWPKLRMTRRFAAPPQAVFDVWTKPEMIRRWLFTAPTTNTVLDIDARVGGTWTIGDRRCRNHFDTPCSLSDAPPFPILRA